MRPENLSNVTALLIVCQDMVGNVSAKSVRCIPTDVLFNPGKVVAVSVFVQSDIERFLKSQKHADVKYYCIGISLPPCLSADGLNLAAQESGIEVVFSGAHADVSGSVFVEYRAAGGEN